MKILTIAIFLFTSFFLEGCRTVRVSAANLKKGNENIVISSVESDVDGINSKSIENQTNAIARSLLNSISINSKDEINLEIKLYEKTYFQDANFIHSLFLMCSFFDSNGEAIAMITEYSTGEDSFYSPEVQEKYLKKCFSKINSLEL